MSKTRMVHVRLPEEIYKKIKIMSIDQKKSFSYLFNVLIEYSLKDNDKRKLKNKK